VRGEFTRVYGSPHPNLLPEEKELKTMKIEQRKENGIWIVTPEGRLDAQTVSLFKKSTQPLLDEENPKLIFDLHEINFIDSTGLGAVISLLRHVQSRQGNIVLTHLTQEVEAILEITRLHRLFNVEPTLEKAIASFEE
jgi:anti-anti-sigma factor